VNPQESAPSSPFTLRWRLFGIRFSIAPSFWIVSALMGWLAIGEGGGGKSFWVCLLIWVLCTLASVLVHELGHIVMARFFGQPGSITLAGMGGQAAGQYEYLTPKERILVAFAGPCAGFVFLGLQTVVDSRPFDWVMSYFDWTFKLHWSLIDYINPLWRMSDGYFTAAMRYLFLMNLIWNVINLLPIFPMDGGMIFREVCCIASPSGGQKFAYGFSFLVSSLGVVYCLLAITVRRDLPTIMHPYFGILMFGMLAYQNFKLLRDTTAAQRSAHYQSQFED